MPAAKGPTGRIPALLVPVGVIGISPVTVVVTLSELIMLVSVSDVAVKVKTSVAPPVVPAGTVTTTSTVVEAPAPKVTGLSVSVPPWNEMVQS
jgi:hypothetical protein